MCANSVFRKSQVQLQSQACKQPTHRRLPPASVGFASDALSLAHFWTLKLGIEKIVADLARAFETALSNCHHPDLVRISPHHIAFI